MGELEGDDAESQVPSLRRRLSSEEERLPRLSTSTSSQSSELDRLEEKHSEQDGHRPSLAEVRSRERTRERTRSRTGTSSGLDMTRTVSRRETILSRIRSRPITRFTHALENLPTGPDQIVDFDGKDDPYHPLNWPEKKKVLSLLYQARFKMCLVVLV